MKSKALTTVLLLSLVSLASMCGEGIDTIEKIKIDKFAYIATVPFEGPYMYQKGGELVGPDAILGEAILARIEAQQSEGATPIRLNWINRTYGTLTEAVKSHEVNMALGVFTITEERKLEIAFSNPYYELDLAVAYNPINLVVKDTSTFGAAKIGVREGTGIESFIQQKYEGSTVIGFKTIDDAVLALRRSEVNVIVDDRQMAAYALTSVPGAQEMEIHPDALGTLQVAVGLPKGDEKLLKLVNEVIAEIQGQIDTAKTEHAGDQLAQVTQRRIDREAELEKQLAPRNISIRVSRARDFSDFDIYRMANLRFEFRNRAGGRSIRSTPVQFQGSTGVCSAKVPPGDYTLAQSKFNFTTPVSIDRNEPNNIRIDITVTRTGVTVNKR